MLFSFSFVLITANGVLYAVTFWVFNSCIFDAINSKDKKNVIKLRF